MCGPHYQKLPITSIPVRDLSLSCSGQLVVKHFQNLERDGLPGSLDGCRMLLPAVAPISDFDIDHSRPVLPVVLDLGLLFGRFVPPSRFLVVFPLDLAGKPGEFRVDVTVEHEFIRFLSRD